jgi:predicted nucleic-acid-binding protein
MEKYYKIAKSEIVDALNRILNFKGIVKPDRSEILSALIKFDETNIDIVDCIIAAQSTPNRVIVSFDKDFSKLKAVSESI